LFEAFHEVFEVAHGRLKIELRFYCGFGYWHDLKRYTCAAAGSNRPASAGEMVRIVRLRPGTSSSREIRHSRGVAQRPLLSTIASGKLYGKFDQINCRLRVPGSRYFGHGSL
jgi:hypothetical protein